MAEYLIDDLISDQVKAEVDALVGAFRNLAKELTEVNNINTVTDEKFQTLVSKVNALEEATNRLAAAKNKAKSAEDQASQSRRKSIEDSDRELAQMNAYYRQIEHRQEIARADREARRLAHEEQKKSIVLTEQEKVNKQALAQVERLQAIIASEYTTALQKNDAQMQLLIRRQQELIVGKQTESKEYLDNVQAIDRLSKEYMEMAKASGMLQRGNARAYTSMFSLTQIMREAPNFAIDMRLGFMSLSNNIPMFVDEFDRLSKSIDSNTGKMMGFGGALKASLKSLISFNTIAVIASTLMIMYGDELAKLFTGKLPAAEAANKAFVKSLKDGNSEMGNASKEILKLQGILQNVDGVYITAAEAVEEYNSKLGDQFGKVNTLAEAQQKIIDMGSNYVKVMGMMAYANQVLELAVKEQMEAEALRANNTIKWYDRLLRRVTGKDVRDAKGRSLLIASQKDLDSIILGERKQKAEKYEKDAEESVRIYMEAIEKAFSTAKGFGIDLFSPTKKTGAGGDTIQQGTDILKEFEFFNEERIRMQSELRDAELALQRESTEGLLQSFENRQKAANDYYEISNRLIDMETENARQNAAEELRVSMERINTTREKNTRLYQEGKISRERFMELESQYNEAEKAISQAYHVDVLKIEDDTIANRTGVYVNFYKYMLALEKDALARRNILIKNNAAEQEAALERAYNTAKAISDNYGKGLSGVFGFSDKGSQVASLSLAKQYNADRLAIQLEEIDARLALVRKGSEDEQKLLDERRLKIMEIDKQQADDSLALKQAEVELKKDLELEAAQLTIELLSTLWDGYYERQLDRLDDYREKFNAIEDERLADVKDREKAGAISSEQAEEETLRIKDFYQAKQDEIDKRQEEVERRKFLWEQAAALAKVWINWGIAVSSPANLLSFGSLTPLYTAIALLSTATIAAQSIPFFAKGGEQKDDGLAVLGDGGKKEFVVSPTGRMFITSSSPELYNLEAGTKIFPDADRVDIASILGLNQRIPVREQDKLLPEIQGLRRDLQRKKFGISNAPMLKQIQFAKEFNTRRRGI